jgi:hypothetical protein
LWIHPEPTNAAYLELWYVPQFKSLENLSDLIPVQFPNGWEEYVIEGVAARILEKEESDASAQRLRQQQVCWRTPPDAGFRRIRHNLGSVEI